MRQKRQTHHAQHRSHQRVASLMPTVEVKELGGVPQQELLEVVLAVEVVLEVADPCP